MIFMVISSVFNAGRVEKSLLERARRCMPGWYGIRPDLWAKDRYGIGYTEAESIKMFVLKCDRCKKEVTAKCPDHFVTEIRTLLRTYLGGTEFFDSQNPQAEHYTICDDCACKLKQFLNNEAIDD